MSTNDVATGAPRAAALAARPRSTRRALGLGLYLAVLMLGSGLVAARQVSAELSERSMALGRRLDGFQQLSGRVTQLSWNGQALSVSTRVVEAPRERVLAHFISLCNAGTAGLTSELAESIGRGEGAASIIERALVMRDLFDDGTGSAVCLAGLGAGGLSGLTARARRFVASWDLSALGQLRYAYLRTLGAARTQVILVSADGALRLDKLVPLDGREVEGADVVAGVKPAQATRMIAAQAHGTPHAFTAYRSRLSAEAALADYGRQLTARSYVRTHAPAEAAEQARDGERAPASSESYRRGPEALVVASQAYEGGSLLSVVRLADSAIPAPSHAAEAADVVRDVVGRGRLGGARDPAFE